MMLRSARRAAFTILEILIAIVVLVLGITGIIALFPTAIESGNKTVEDSYAAAITQSVVDALSVGVRESRYNTTQNSRVYTYFIFNHDGVVDQAPNAPATFATAMGTNVSQGAIWRRDFCIILPSSTVAGDNKDLLMEPNFVFPVPSYVADSAVETAKNTDVGLNQRSPTKLGVFGGLIDNLDVNFRRPASAGGENVPWYSRVFHLGRYREAQDGGPPLPTGPDGVIMKRGDIRLEYRGDAISTGGTSTEQTIAIDPYPSYAFCFTLQRARVDTSGAAATDPPDGRLTQTDSYSDTLYQLRVMIFKNFDAEAAFELRPADPANPSAPMVPGMSVPKTNVPIRDFVTLIAL